MSRKSQSILSVLAATALTGGVLVAGTTAANASVGTVYDLTAGGACTFSDALQASNTDSAVGSCAAGFGADTILLAAQSYTGTFDITDDLSIQGQGQGSTVLNGGSAGTTLTVGGMFGSTHPNVTLEGLDVTGGVGGVTGVSAGLAMAAPGGILNHGNLTLTDVRVHGNTGKKGFGYSFQGGGGTSSGPGGVLNADDGTLTIGTDSLIDANTGGVGGDGSQGTVIGGLPPDQNPGTVGGRGGEGGAGGIANVGTLVVALDASGVTGNTGGAGGKGGEGGGGSPQNCDGGPGGTGGLGGPGGVWVVDGSAVSGPASLVTGNAGGAGGAGGIGGDSGSGGTGCQDGASGAIGATGEATIRKGGQTLSWTTAPPARVVTGGGFTVKARSTSGLTPSESATGECSGTSGVSGYHVTAGADASNDCTVTADQAGDDWFKAASTLTGVVNVVDPVPVTVNQALGQADPDYDGEADFTAVFDEPVSQLEALDISVTGVSSGSHGVTVTRVANNKFTITVGWQGSGPVSVSIPAHVVTTSDGIPNAASTSTDNEVLMDFDATGPFASPTVDPPANGNGWNDGDVTVTWNWTDNKSGTDNCDVTTTSSGEGSAVEVSSTCSDLAGNSTTETVTVKVDKGEPILSPTVTPFVSALQGPAPVADPAADDEGSGVDSSSCDTPTTAALGAFTVECTASDAAGNSATASASYVVTNAFLGFQSPLPKAKVKKSSTIPVKFTVGNYSGTQKSSTAVVRVQLSTKLGNGTLGPRIGNPLACPYSSTSNAYQCNFKAAKSVSTDGTKYFLTVYQRIAGDWYQMPNGSGVTNNNVTQVTFK